MARSDDNCFQNYAPVSDPLLKKGFTTGMNSSRNYAPVSNPHLFTTGMNSVHFAPASSPLLKKGPSAGTNFVGTALPPFLEAPELAVSTRAPGLFVADVLGGDSNYTKAFCAFLDTLFIQGDESSGIPVAYYASPRPKPRAVHSTLATLDSGATVHLWSLRAAQQFFRDKSSSTLKIQGISATPSTADLQGRLVVSVVDEHANSFELDLGTSFAIDDLAVNLLSVSLLISKGAVLHFEKGNCYFEAHQGAPKIALIQANGLFHLPMESCLPKAPGDSGPLARSCFSYAVGGTCYGASAAGRLWHRRIRHLPLDRLAAIHGKNLVGGFSIKGELPRTCQCDTCRQAKIRRRAVPRVSNASKPSFVGHTVSTDVKQVPYTSMRGYRYVVNFVDHYSRLGFCYFMRNKSETAGMLRLYLGEMRRLGVTVRTIQSDRGSEYFSQEGDTHQDRDRGLTEFTKICEAASPKIHHVVTAVEMHEKLAEVWFRDHFEAVDAMLWDARLSPVFWADALAYSQHVANRVPRPGSDLTPWELATGDKPRWDKFKVFGCDVYEHIPNNSLAKVPGMPKGRRLLFMGFNHRAAGWQVFDPETRRYFSTNDAYFYEDFSHRVDALRHHDRRRELMRRGGDIPLVLDDFDRDSLQASVPVRKLYLDPDQVKPAPIVKSRSLPASRVIAESEGAAAEPEGARVLTPVPSDGDSDNESDDEPSRGPLRSEAQRAERARQVLREGVLLRPLRTSAIGVPLKVTPEDTKFIEHVKRIDAPVKYLSPCPKKGQHSDSRARYLKYMHASTYLEARLLGATAADFEWDYLRGYISFPKHEPDLPGHVFNAFELAEQHGYTHILDDVGRFVKRSDETDFKLAQAFASLSASTKARDHFNDLVANAFEPDGIMAMFEQREAALRFADAQMARVMNASSSIDLSIAPEPTRFEMTLPDVCDEHAEWRAAMEDEMESMSRFQVYRRVPKSVARGRQILGCKWVYKRKVNEFGQVYRHRARLVAQGFRQKAFDSYQPDETYSPVVHKDSLRTFLSVCAAENLRVYAADVKSAYLQSHLKERIYLQCPPGFGSVTESGEEEVLELSKAIYGLKQSSACFWEAMREHLESMGFVSMLSDPCLFKKVAHGKIILVCTYVDDVTYGVSDEATADQFLTQLKERFVIEEGEGKPISWLLNMKVTQDLDAGTISLNQEVAIVKLAKLLLTPEELTKAASVHYPMLAQPLPKLQERLVPKEQFDFLSVVGSLLHIANCVRCDVAHAVSVLTRHALCPGPAHVRAAKRVVMYLYNTRLLGITYRRPARKEHANIAQMYEGAKHPLDDGKNLVQTFADSDYASDDTKRSTMGMVVMLNGGPVSWGSILGKTIATSTCEAEVNAAVVAAKDALHISQLLKDLGYSPGGPLQIAEDNAACIAQAKSGLRHVRNAKHYQVKLRFLQQLVVDKDIEFIYCPTDLQLADFFTKPLVDAKYISFRNIIFGMK